MSLNFGKQWRRRPHSPPDWESWYHKQPYKYKKTAETLYSSSRPTRLHSYSVTGPRIFQPGSPFLISSLLCGSSFLCLWIIILLSREYVDGFALQNLPTPRVPFLCDLFILLWSIRVASFWILWALLHKQMSSKYVFFGEDCFKMKYVIVAVAWMERGGLSANLSLSAGRV